MIFLISETNLRPLVSTTKSKIKHSNFFFGSMCRNFKQHGSRTALAQRSSRLLSWGELAVRYSRTWVGRVPQF